MYDRAYIDYLVNFHCKRDYFECHEILEEHWKSSPPNERKGYWVALIQIAVALYHQRRDNYRGALKMISSAIQMLEQNLESIQKLGLHSEELLTQLRKRQKEIEDRKCYYSFNLPIADNELIDRCTNICRESKLVWGQASDFSNDFLINKHTKRNRTGVIQERLNQLELRRKSRNSI